MVAAVGHIPAKVLSMEAVALNGGGVGIPPRTAVLGASQHSAPVESQAPTRRVQRPCKSALTRHVVDQPVKLAKARVLATAARNMAIVEAQATFAAQAVKEALVLVVKLHQECHQVYQGCQHRVHLRCHHQVRPLKL
jgi:hypothetical protein